MESPELKGIDEDEQKIEGCEDWWFEKRIEDLKSEVEEMKRKRMEDMKANEKVLTIFASKEEAWKREKRKLLQELDALREIAKCNKISSHEKKSENIVQAACSNKEKNEDFSEDHQESSAESRTSTPPMDEMILKHSKEVHQRKLAYGKYVAVISDLKAQKEKVENMLRNTLVEMGAWKRDAVLKAKEKKLVDAALRKVTEEILRLQKEMDDKDKAIAQIKDKELGGNRVLEAELRAKELELSNAKMLLQQYTQGGSNREREVEKWKRLYLGIKLELDNLHVQMVGRQSSGLLIENDHNSKGETSHSGSLGSRNTKRGEEYDLEKKKLLQEIEAKNEQIQRLRRQRTNMEKEMEKKEKKIEFLSKSLNNDKEDKVETQKEGMSMKHMFFLARSKSCNSDSNIILRQKTSKNHDSKTVNQKVPRG